MAKRKKVSKQERDRRNRQSEEANGVAFLSDGKGGFDKARKTKQGWMFV